MDREIKRYELKVTSLSEEGKFSGLLSVYDVRDSYGDIVERGAYTKTLQETGGRVPLLWQHDPALPIGMLSLKDGKEGLEAEGQLVLDEAVPQAKTAYALLKAGVVRGLSIGFKTMKQKKEDTVRFLKEIKLFEGSLVTIPANHLALVHDVKSLGVEHKDFLEELDRIQTWSTHYHMLQALSYSLDELRYSSTASKEDRIAAATLIIEQFTEAYIAFLPKLMDQMGIKRFAPPSMIPLEAHAALADLGTKFLALTAPHSGTPNGAAGAAPVEKKTVEPDLLHSALLEFANPERWRS